MSKAPPWVLFTDKNKPVAILPAGRPGEVADVSRLTMGQATEIVCAANRLHNLIVAARLHGIESGLAEIAAKLDQRDAAAASAAVDSLDQATGKMLDAAGVTLGKPERSHCGQDPFVANGSCCGTDATCSCKCSVCEDPR